MFILKGRQTKTLPSPTKNRAAPSLKTTRIFIMTSLQTQTLESLGTVARVDEALRAYRKVAAQQLTQPHPVLPPAFISIEANPISGEARCLNLLLTDRATATHDISWQERRSRAHLLGEVQYADGQWLISVVKHGVLQDVALERFQSAEAAALKLYSRFQKLKALETELQRQANRERDAA